MNTEPSLALGAVGFVLIIIGIILAIAWLFLPLLILSRLSKIHRELMAQTKIFDRLTLDK
jgi:uncharacterized protein YoxC